MDNTMDTVRIEMLAKIMLESALLRTGRVVPDIKTIDKTPSWDGELYVYNDCDSSRKDNLYGRIPLQLKGTYVRNFQNGQVPFSVSVSDLTNYFNDGGVIFFVVQLRSPDDYRIYYTNLLPFDLRRLLDDCGDQKTKTIHLDIFRHRNPRAMLNILLGFIQDKRKQGQLLPNVKSIRDLNNIDFEKIEISIPRFEQETKEETAERLLGGPVYIYAKPRNLEASFAIDKMVPQGLAIEKNMPIIVDGEILFDHVVSTIDANGHREMKIGGNITVSEKDGRPHFKASFSGTLDQQIRQLQFMAALIEKKNVSFSNQKIEVDVSTLQGQSAEDLLDRLNGLQAIKRMLDQLHVRKDLNLDQLTEDEIHKLNMLTNSILRHVPVPLHAETSQHEVAPCGRIVIGNVVVFVSCERPENGQGMILADFFCAKEIRVVEGENTPQNGTPISPYVLVTQSMLETVDNIYLPDAVASIKKYPYSKLYEDYIIGFVLEILKYYDAQGPKNAEILEVAKDLVDYVEENTSVSTDIAIINRLQIQKRFGEDFSQEEKRYLVSLKSKDSRPHFRLAANILLESYMEAELVYSEMSAEERENFAEFPIMNLWPDHPN